MVAHDPIIELQIVNYEEWREILEEIGFFEKAEEFNVENDPEGFEKLHQWILRNMEEARRLAAEEGGDA